MYSSNPFVSCHHCRAGHQRRFIMRKRRKYRSPSETVPFEKYRLVDNGEDVSFKIMGVDGELKIRGQLPTELVGRADETTVREEVKIMRTRLGYYYALVTVKIVQRSVPDRGESICSIDPGVRSFLTWYSDVGRSGTIGRFDPQQALLKEADDIQGRLTREGGRHRAAWRRRMTRQFLRRLDKVRQRTKDLHHKVASWMCATFRLILLPKFDVSNMISRGYLRSKTCRAMQTWGHFGFREHMISHAQLYQDCKLRLVNEAYTSKTCGSCGVINHSLGGAAVFRCGTCGFEIGRDYQGARGVLMRALPYILRE